MKSKNSNKPPDDKTVAEAVEKGKSKAEQYLKDKEKVKKLAGAAVQKAKDYEKDKGPLEAIWEYLLALIRLLLAYIRGEYRDIPWASIVLIIVAIAYFVSPIDLIPDFIPLAGYVDDAAVIAFVIAQVAVDLDNFIRWERAQKDASA
jgi:uncharacterized membrane protein YkvA (DUF1232 family)